MTMLHDEELARILLDDCPYSDPTTEGLGIAAVPAVATLTARGDMVVCGIEEAARMFELSGGNVRLAARSGDLVAAGALLLEVSGTGRCHPPHLQDGADTG